jgi:DNA polymerase-4
MQRVILHADMDAFYASVEQRDRPELRGRPVVVGGTGTRGVVSAASYEARAFGVRSAIPTAEARRLCPQAVFLPGDMKRYAAESRKIFAIFERFTPRVQGLSLDEAFLDLSGSERLLGAPAEVGAALRRAVRAELGLAVSVGIAPGKLAAKIASDLAKPDGLRVVAPEELREFLAPLPVARLWGVGPVAEAKLVAAGFRTIGDLAAADPVALERCFGAQGVALAQLARGDDRSELIPDRESISYSEENTFARDVGDFATLERAIRAHAEAVARRLRRDGRAARSVVLKLKLARRVAAGPRGYPLLTRRASLPQPCDDGPALAAAARELLRRVALTEPVRLLGVGATRIVGADDAQLSLFEPAPERRKSDAINRALDLVRDRFGAGALVRGPDASAPRAGLTLSHKRGE